MGEGNSKIRRKAAARETDGTCQDFVRQGQFNKNTQKPDLSQQGLDPGVWQP